ncbi:hypothetical protein AB0442_37400 [Kitasatospora sp. NPDC085895]|uniref:aromatic-ring hydroxylase C-terminal domain-containing protein n=1 Tax=Kitasatospora sp. NPDC085895 TaxID=3155057 RepID=UPI00344C6CE3
MHHGRPLLLDLDGIRTPHPADRLEHRTLTVDTETAQPIWRDVTTVLIRPDARVAWGQHRPRPTAPRTASPPCAPSAAERHPVSPSAGPTRRRSLMDQARSARGAPSLQAGVPLLRARSTSA